MKEFGLQTYSIRDQLKSEENTRAALKAIREAGYTSIQTAGFYDSITPERLREFLDEAGLTVCGTHYNYDKIVGDVEGTIAYHNVIGTTNIGIGGMPVPARENEAELDKFIETYNEMAKIYSAHGFKLTYHNHSFEFVKLADGRTIFDRLIEEFDKENITFVVDTFWLQYAGIDVRDMLERLAGRVEILHLKDMTAKRDDSYPYPIVEIGVGVMNFGGIIEVAEKIGVKHYIVEDDRCIEGESLNCARRSAEYIKANLIK